MTALNVPCDYAAFTHLCVSKVKQSELSWRCWKFQSTHQHEPPVAQLPNVSKLPVTWISRTGTVTVNPYATQHSNEEKVLSENAINPLQNGSLLPLMRCHFNKPVCWTTEPFGKHYCSFACWHPGSTWTHMDPSGLRADVESGSW